ncbi:hypothetical protein [Streptomyces sp. NPDC055060]
MSRHRLHVDGDCVAAVTWWSAIAAGLALLGVSVHHDVTTEVAPPSVSAPDTVPDESGSA